MDLTIQHNLDKLLERDQFYLLMLNGGLELEEYGLSELFERGVPPRSVAPSATPSKDPNIYINPTWSLHVACNNSDDESLLLVHRHDPLKSYTLRAPFWIATDLGGEEETAETWTERLRLYTNVPAYDRHHTEYVFKLLQEIHAFDHWRTYRHLMVNLPTRWMRETIKGYYARHKDEACGDIDELTKPEVHQWIWNLFDDTWVRSEFRTMRDWTGEQSRTVIKRWEEHYEEARDEIRNGKRFKQCAKEEEEELL